MPICAVLKCRNHKLTKNPDTTVTYHQFPKHPVYRMKWIQFTGHDNTWKPSKTDCLCSIHFKMFIHSKNNIPFLPSNAIPTIRDDDRTVDDANHPIVSNDKTISNQETLSGGDEETYESANDDEEDDDDQSDYYDEPPAKKRKPQNKSSFKRNSLDNELAKVEFELSVQNRKIKHQLQRLRRFNARLPRLRDEIVNLNKSNETVCTYLENLGFPIASEILSRIILCDRCIDDDTSNVENPYSEQFEKFIVTLYSLSPAAYNLMRETFPEGVFPDEVGIKYNCSILEADFMV